MKIAIALYGIYSDYYKKNNYQGDIYGLTYENKFIDDNQIIKQSFITNELLDVDDVSLIKRKSYVKKACIEYCYDMIRSNGVKYDIILFATFRDIILDFPKEKGVYRTNYYMAYEYIPYTIVKSIEIVSDTYIRIDGSVIQYIYDIDKNTLQLLLNILFDGRVIQPSFISENSIAKTLFCIPSVIKTSTKPFNYVGYRSVFTHEERFEQTLEQVKSLSVIDNSDIYLLEGSQLNLKEMKLLTEYSKIILFCKDETGNDYSNNHPNKSIYEVYCMKFMLTHFDFDWCLKFGGRYKLHYTFDINNFLEDKPVFKNVDAKNTFTQHESIVECIIYSIPKKDKQKFIKVFEKLLSSLYCNNDLGIENELYKLACDKDFIRTNTLNVYGRDAIEGFDNLV